MQAKLAVPEYVTMKLTVRSTDDDVAEMMLSAVG